VTAPAALTLEHLTVEYVRQDRPSTPVVLDVSLRLTRGRVLGLAGESGCGKSTTALAAIGYRPPGSRVCAGTAQFNDVDLLALAPDALRRIWGRRIAYVAQNASTALNPAVTIDHQLAQPLRTHLGLRGGAVRERQLTLLDAVAIDEPASALPRFPHQFSGGQQQRLAIALAIACQPEVLILDEPTTGLDVTTQARISGLLRTLVREAGMASLYVSHDLALLGTLADEVAVMYAGQIVEKGPASTVLGRPRHPYVRALMAAVPSAHERRQVVGIPGRPPARVVVGSCAFAPRCDQVVDACWSTSVPVIPVPPDQSVRCLRPEATTARPRRTAAERATTPEPATPLLDVEHLSCAYIDAPSAAVRDVSFSVRRGETVGIVGESGSGKSTLLRAIAGLHPWRAGVVRFEGLPLAKAATDRPRRVAGRMPIVFQNPDSSLNPRHTVLESVRRPIRLFRDDVPPGRERDAVADLLEAVKLPGSILNRYPSQLSGGQKQRVAIARAFAARPALLLCDEITSSLDVSVQATIIELVAELSTELGTAVVFVSHDLAVVRTIATRALVMRSGEIHEEGPTERLFTSPRHAYTRDLIGAIPRLPHATREDPATPLGTERKIT
jgi:peptide/nickel transport system ATP-binding protein